MNITIIIPTYWTSLQLETKDEPPDAIYDHPTPLESQSDLPRLLNSLKDSDLHTESTSIFVIAAATHQRLEEKAKCRVDRIIEEHKSRFCIKCFSASTLNRLLAVNAGLVGLLSLCGYSNIRNTGLAAAQIMNSDVIVFLDDDVIVKDRAYMQKTTQHIGKQIQRRLIGGVAGYYTDIADNHFLDLEPMQWWTVFWPKKRKMNEAFRIVDVKRRLVETTFAFGGNMALHWKMFERIPFDPYITRGEDMDLLLNAKMFGFEFLLDTDLKVVHLPGKGMLKWSEMRQDLYRFLYMREKILSQKHVKDVVRVSLDSFMPYPGYFLRSGTMLRFSASSSLHILHSLIEGEMKNAKEFLQNLVCLPDAFHSAKEHALDYFGFQKKWSSIIPEIRDNKELKNALETPRSN